MGIVPSNIVQWPHPQSLAENEQTLAAYYNEIDPYAASWIKSLIAAGLVPAGDVDERSIVDVRADDLRGYTQCHFFAGIAGWAYALRLAGWSDERSVWTGSCPCQPFSGANKHARGEADERHLWPHWLALIKQLRPAIIFGEQVASGGGPSWIARVRDDLEISNYAFGAANLAACCVGAPQKGERFWFVAMGETESLRRGQGVEPISRPKSARQDCGQPTWSDETALGCDGRRRRAVPGTPVVGHGIPARIPKLRAIGSAIVPQVAAAFIMSAAPANTGGD